MKLSGRRFLLLFAPLALATPSLFAQEKLEIKFLAVDAATIGSIKTSLALDKTTAGEPVEIHFFDTPSLTLLKEQKLTFQLRRKGKTWTFTIREALPGDQPRPEITTASIDTEESIATLEKLQFHSIDSNPSNASIKAALESDSIEGLLSLPQQDFLKRRSHQIPWDRLRSFPTIEARRWSLDDSKTLAADTWQYPGGELLEITYKTKPKDPTTAEKKFTTWLTDHAIKPKEGGSTKTTTVLEALTKQLPAN
jgi:uncharacterized protein YjbK